MEFSSSHFQRPQYRADIDGLRAVAVLSVLAYHAMPLWLPGGFIGVDVFFVISGFLITSLILGNLARGSFSITEFYGRRVKRIFPALLVVLLATYVCGWQVLLADEYAQLGAHIAGGASFVSNLLLWHESGYFDNASYSKPLLHLWSLGIEEQFYVLWPWLLCLAHRRAWPAPALLVVLIALSFAANLVRLEHDSVAAFYAPDARFWELFCGALLAYRQRGLPRVEAPPMSSALGMALIVSGLFIISEQSPFPGVWAAMPVIGAVLVITAGPQAWLNRVVLSAPTMVWFGRISFPLYLWHWSLLSYLRILVGGVPPIELCLGAAALAVLLAWLTYRWVEHPVRFGPSDERRAVSLATLLALFGAVGYLTYGLHGLPARAVAELNESNSALLEWQFPNSDECRHALGANMTFCVSFGDGAHPRVAVLGDSTAHALAPGLAARELEHGAGLINIGSFGCPPIRGLVEAASWKKGSDCVTGTRRSYELVARSKSIEVVVLGVFARDLKSWAIPGVASGATAAQRFAALTALLDSDIRYLIAAGKRVVVTYDMPMAPVQPRECLPRPYREWLLGEKSECFVREQDLVDRHPYLDLFDAFLSTRTDICVLRQSRLLLSGGRLRFADESGRLLLRDDHHLSTYGSARMAELLAANCGTDKH